MGIQVSLDTFDSVDLSTGLSARFLSVRVCLFDLSTGLLEVLKS